jgi:hypothetical protein
MNTATINEAMKTVELNGKTYSIIGKSAFGIELQGPKKGNYTIGQNKKTSAFFFMYCNGASSKTEWINVKNA